MELLVRSQIAKVLYGVLFVVLVPLALVAWAHGAGIAVPLPAFHPIPRGPLLMACGAAFMAFGMLTLWRDGGGLPMNAFPPPRLVEKSIYSVVPHPIYGGFVILCAGVAIFYGSTSGLWLVTPCVALACSALVLGYEAPDLRKRFGVRTLSLWLPCNRAEAPSLMERLRVYLVVLLPWLVVYELLGALGKPSDAVSTYLPFEMRLPVIAWTELPYASTYLVVLAAPLMARSGTTLRRFALRGLTAMAFIFPLYLLLPFFVPPRPFQPGSLLDPMLLWERAPSSGIAAFPSFHVAWAFIAASTLGGSSRWRRFFWWLWALLVALSCIATGMHSIADVLAGALAYQVVVRMPDIWKAILHVAESIANCWKEWRWGPVRIINHGGFAAVASLFGVWMIDAVLGSGREALTLSIFFCSIVGAALWAQWVEGSPSLLRPMGFYGGMLGAAVGAVPAFFLHVSLWHTFAAVCVAAPGIQALGRLRCLVQGCCHGRPVASVEGIRYTHPRSRVCRLAHLDGVPVHAAPVYSILCNLVVGLALLRLLQLHSSPTFLCGVYLLLSSTGRFVEEAYRGEPQTLTVYSLHLYQWITILIAVAGAAITTIPTSPLAHLSGSRPSSVLLAFGCGAITWFVTGIDFPESSRRFARLT